MLDIPNIPDMVIPSPGSTLAFVAVIGFIAVSIVVGVWLGGTAIESAETKRRWGIRAAIGMLVWLAT